MLSLLATLRRHALLFLLVVTAAALTLLARDWLVPNTTPASNSNPRSPRNKKSSPTPTTANPPATPNSPKPSLKSPP